MKFYRYEAVQYATTDYDGELKSPDLPCPRLECREFQLKKETPKGYWIGWEWDDFLYKWVSKTSVKRFAYPTKEEALTNFIERKNRQIEILEYQINSAKYALVGARRLRETMATERKSSPFEDFMSKEYGVEFVDVTDKIIK